jgi:hypothetical protein
MNPLTVTLIEIGEIIGIPVAQSRIDQVIPDGVRYVVHGGKAFYSAADVADYHRARGRKAFADCLDNLIQEALLRPAMERGHM